MFMGTITELGIALADLCEGLKEWSEATFGSDQERGPVGPLRHLKKECDEALADPAGREEYADLLILVIDAARRAGIKPMELLGLARAKLDVNRKRSWPKPDAWVFEETVFLQSEDCMGEPVAYWRTCATRDGECVMGAGATKEEAEAKCRKNVSEQPTEHVR